MKSFLYEQRFEDAAFHHFGREWDTHPIINLLFEEFGQFISHQPTKHLMVRRFESGLCELRFFLATECCRVELFAFFEETDELNLMREMVVFSISNRAAA